MKSKLIIPILALVLLPAAFGFLGTLGDTISTINIADFYLDNTSIIDFALFTIFFGALARKILEGRFGKKVALAIGLILGLSLTVYMSMNGISLVQFGVLGMTMFLIVFAVMLYSLLMAVFGVDGSTHRVKSIALTFLILWPLFQAMVPAYFDWMRETPGMRTIYAMLQLFWAVILILAIVRFFMNLGGKGDSSSSGSSGSSGGSGGGSSGGTPPKPTGFADAIKEKVAKLAEMIKTFEASSKRAGQLSGRNP